MKSSATRTIRYNKAPIPGKDAVIYRLVPSWTSVTLSYFGSELVPEVDRITLRVTKQVGDDTPTTIPPANWVAEGIGIICFYNRGSVSGELFPYTASGIEVKADASSVRASLMRGGFEVDAVNVPFIADGTPGKDGSDACILDLDNEMEAIPCAHDGTPVGTGTLASCTATVYKGAKVDSGWTFSRDDSGCTSTIDASTGVVTVSAITADRASVKVTATKGTQSLSAVMTLYKVKPGSPGASPVIYSIETSVSSISIDKNGTVTPNSLSAYKIKTTGSSRVRTSEMTLSYQREGQDAVAKIFAGDGGTIKISSDCTAVRLILIDNNGVTLDYERIPVVRDGKDGEDGKPGDRGSRGPTLRGPQFWDQVPVGYEFQCGAEGEDFLDVVIYGASNSFYACKSSHKKTASNAPTSSVANNNGLWQLAANFDIVATRLLLAEFAIIKNLGVEALEMKDAAGNILCRIKDGNVECNTGSFKNVAVAGDITADTLSLKIATENVAGYPNGSLLFGVSELVLAPLALNTSRSLRIINPCLSRTIPDDLIITATNGKVTETIDYLRASSSVTIPSGGGNSGKSYDLLGINVGNYGTVWYLTETNISNS